MGLFDSLPVVQPTQLQEAGVVRLAPQMIEGVAEVSPPSISRPPLGDDLSDGGAKASVIVSHHELAAVKAAPTEPEQEVLPRRTALAVGHIHDQKLAALVPADSDGAISTAWLPTTLLSRTSS
jgi:hypothetical protein